LGIFLLSFGYRYGLPEGFDVVLDLRSLPVPSLKWSLKGLTGLDPVVRSTVLGSKKCQALLERCRKKIEGTMIGRPLDAEQQVTIAVGCGGGRHRAVVVAEELRKKLKADGFKVTPQHRDIRKHLWGILDRT